MRVLIAWLLSSLALAGGTWAQAPRVGEFTQITVKNSLDQADQACGVFLPDAPDSAGPRPLLVFLHSWSSGLEQNNNRWLDLAKERNWVFLHPDFRGRNNRPEACGSALVRQDILDAMAWVMTQKPIDRSRIYLAGTSGGGHLTMLMAGYHPDKFSAASSWVGISDLTKWHQHTSQAAGQARYARDIETCVGGAPGSSPAADEQLKQRSPVFHLAAAKELPLDINTGVHDGHTGSVPVAQSFAAFNVVAQARGDKVVPEDVITFWNAAGKETAPRTAVLVDEPYGRAILFRAQSGPVRLTVFEGGHEDRPLAGIKFLESRQRPTSWPAK